MVISDSDRIENIVGKGENAGYQYFLLFSQCFHKPSFPEPLQVENVWWSVKKQHDSRFLHIDLFQEEKLNL